MSKRKNFPDRKAKRQQAALERLADRNDRTAQEQLDLIQERTGGEQHGKEALKLRKALSHRSERAGASTSD